MTKKEVLIKEIAESPDSVVSEMLDFLTFLKAKSLGKMETALLSEAALAESWLDPSEDETWKNL